MPFQELWLHPPSSLLITVGGELAEAEIQAPITLPDNNGSVMRSWWFHTVETLPGCRAGTNQTPRRLGTEGRLQVNYHRGIFLWLIMLGKNSVHPEALFLLITKKAGEILTLTQITFKVRLQLDDFFVVFNNMNSSAFNANTETETPDLSQAYLFVHGKETWRAEQKFWKIFLWETCSTSIFQLACSCKEAAVSLTWKKCLRWDLSSWPHLWKQLPATTTRSGLLLTNLLCNCAHSQQQNLNKKLFLKSRKLRSSCSLQGCSFQRLLKQDEWSYKQWAEGLPQSKSFTMKGRNYSVLEGS